MKPTTTNRLGPNQYEQLSVELDGAIKRGGIQVPRLKIANNFSTSEIETALLTGQRLKRTAFSGSNYTLATSDFLLGITSLALAPSIGLPDARQVGVGKTFTVKDEVGGAATTTITIRSENERNIDGAATSTLTTNYQAKSYYSDGSNWFTR